jgi:hypothetical protein
MMVCAYRVEYGWSSGESDEGFSTCVLIGEIRGRQDRRGFVHLHSLADGSRRGAWISRRLELIISYKLGPIEVFWEVKHAKATQRGISYS